MIEKQKNHKSDFIEIEKHDINIWKLHLKEREHMLTQIAEYRRKNRIREWIELIFMLGLICYMLYDIYKA